MISNSKALVDKAILGDKKSLTQLIKSVENLIYNLSVRMLWHPQDAEDASQEIIIRVITNLNTFKGNSKFSTWVYRLATNHLLTILKRGQNKKTLNFVEFSNELQKGLEEAKHYSLNQGEQNLLVQEMKIGCSNGMLQCLDADSRTSYILGDILEFNSTEAAYIQNIKPATFRKRVSRARNDLFAFMRDNCGIVNSGNACRCRKQIAHCIGTGKIEPGKLRFATDGADIELLDKIESAEKSMVLFSTNPDYELPEKAVREIRGVLGINHAKQDI